MATIKAFSDLQQSKKLAEILPIESADMYWWSSGKRYYIEAMDDGDFNEGEGHIRAWSLAALLSVLPSSIKDSIGTVYSLNMNKEYIEYSNPNISSLCSAYIHTCGNDNLVDACYELILKLHELKML